MHLIQGKREYVKREFASLTKMMTCFTVIKLTYELRLDPMTYIVSIGKWASETPGTTANLKFKD